MRVTCPHCQTKVVSRAPELTCPGCGQQISAVEEPVFNPYSSWFDIPVSEQPPTFYRLLGLAPFEGDHDLIDKAARSRARRLKKVLTGPKAADAEKLLREVKRARKYLLDPSRKQAYDASLETAPSSPAPNAVPPSATRSDEAPAPQLNEFPPAGFPRSGLPSRRLRRRPSSTATPVIGAVIGGGLALVLGYVLFFHYIPKLVRDSQPAPAATTASQPPATTLRAVRPAPSNRTAAARPRSAERDSEPSAPVGTAADEQISAAEQATQIESRLSLNESQPQQAAEQESVPLDLSRNTMYVEMPEPLQHVTITQLNNVPTSYELKPSDGVVRVGTPVVAELTERNGTGIGVLINFSLTRRAGARALKIEPAVELAWEKTLQFNLDRINNRRRTFEKTSRRVATNLAMTQRQIAEIEAWLKSPVLKDLPVKIAREQQLGVLKKQAAAGTRMMQTYSAQGQQLVRLAELAEQLHEKAEVMYRVALE